MMTKVTEPLEVSFYTSIIFILTLYTCEMREVDFEKKIPTIAVVRGSEANMKCTVKNLAHHEVSWIHVDKQLLLTKQQQVRTDNERIHVRRENNTFILMITNASLEDIGYYACRINSHPPKSQVGFLDVLVPPYFVDTNSSGDSEIIIREYESISLPCRAIANPPPRVTWRREDSRDITVLNSTQAVKEVTGDILHLTSVGRWNSGSFICTVTSGISAPISRRINLLVQFAPMIKVASQASTFHTGSTGSLECISESYPLGTFEWFNVHGKRITNSLKYSLIEERTFLFRVIHKLTIKQVAHSDAGRYTCSISNSLGTTSSKLTLYVIDRWKQTLNSTKFAVTSSSVVSFPSSTVPTTITSAINSNVNYTEITSASSKRKYTKDTMITNYQEHIRRKQQSVKHISSSSSSSSSSSAASYTRTCLGVTMYTSTLFLLYFTSMYHSRVK